MTCGTTQAKKIIKKIQLNQFDKNFLIIQYIYLSLFLTVILFFPLSCESNFDRIRNKFTVVQLSKKKKIENFKLIQLNSLKKRKLKLILPKALTSNQASPMTK